jgi:hypothetical protein
MNPHFNNQNQNMMPQGQFNHNQNPFNKNPFQNDPVYLNWVVIFFALAIFFPIGIFLIIMKVNYNKQNIFRVGKGTLIMSIIFFFLSVCMFAVIFDPVESNYASDFFLAIVFLGVGILLLSMYFNNKKKARNYKQFLHLVINERITDLNMIAVRMQKDINSTSMGLGKLIMKGYLPGYRIDGASMRLICPVEEANRAQFTRVVSCPNCGATNRLETQIGTCRYCSSYIQ